MMSESNMLNAGLIILFLFYCYFMIGGYTEDNCRDCKKDAPISTQRNDSQYDVKNSEYFYRPNQNANYLDTIQQDRNMMNIYQKAPWL